MDYALIILSCPSPAARRDVAASENRAAFQTDDEKPVRMNMGSVTKVF
jgi:hypothetical protein